MLKGNMGKRIGQLNKDRKQAPSGIQEQQNSEFSSLHGVANNNLTQEILLNNNNLDDAKASFENSILRVDDRKEAHQQAYQSRESKMSPIKGDNQFMESQQSVGLGSLANERAPGSFRIDEKEQAVALLNDGQIAQNDKEKSRMKDDSMAPVYKEPKRPAWKKKIEQFLENWFVVGLMSVVTIYALFFDDLRIIFLP